MDWLNLIFSAAGGGVLGLVGSGIKMFAAHKKEEQRLRAETLLIDKQLKLMDQEMKLAQVKGTLDLELQESTDDSANLRAALEAEASISNTPWWVDAVRGLTRPILTFFLTVAAFVKPDEEDLVWMASTAVSFWFGDRPRKSK